MAKPRKASPRQEPLAEVVWLPAGVVSAGVGSRRCVDDGERPPTWENRAAAPRGGAKKHGANQRRAASCGEPPAKRTRGPALICVAPEPGVLLVRLA